VQNDGRTYGQNCPALREPLSEAETLKIGTAPLICFAFSVYSTGDAVKRAAEAAGLPQAEDYTGPSLRAGHIRQALMEGAPDAAIQAQSRHESARAFREYVRPKSFWRTRPVRIWGFSFQFRCEMAR
jgi:hypothetical protein